MHSRPRQIGFLTFAVLLFAAGCATQRPPEGGPPDTDPPLIIETDPANGTVLFTGQEVSFEFSEYIQRQSFQESVHISPLPETPPTYEWSGRRVSIVFDAPLTANRTYVITVGTKVRDLRAGNAMQETMHLAFSTGDSLDRGSFSGTVNADPPGGVTIFAYLLEPGRADTLNPADDRPDYAVQSAEDGSFHFYNVAPGVYRVFAVRDKSNDFRYNAESEEIGVPDFDVLIEDSLALTPPLRFQLHTEDTTRPQVQRIEALDERTVRIKFNETVYPQPLPLDRVMISDSTSGRRLTLLSAVAPPKERYAWDFRMGEALTEQTYRLSIDSLEDGAGNLVDTTGFPFFFRGSAAADTLRPFIVEMTPTENSRNVNADSSFRVDFDRPLSVGDAFTLRDSSGATIALSISIVTRTTIMIGHPPLLPEAVYSLCITENLLRDSLSGRSIGDSIRCIRFTTGKRDQYGTLSGVVRSTDSTGAAVVRVREAVKQPRVRTVFTDSTRTFRFDGLPEGKYLLDAYIDVNGNRRYDAGKPFPLTKPEPFGAVRDTLRVRARWATDNIIIPLQSSQDKSLNSPPDSTSGGDSAPR
jgi:uncharacterized protein (DUF2141 family)